MASMTVSMFRRRPCVTRTIRLPLEARTEGTYGVAPAELEWETHDDLFDFHLCAPRSVWSNQRVGERTIRSFFSLTVNFALAFFFGAGFCGADFVLADVEVRAVVNVVS